MSIQIQFNLQIAITTTQLIVTNIMRSDFETKIGLGEEEEKRIRRMAVCLLSLLKDYFN